jgi:hypothetical protein
MSSDECNAINCLSAKTNTLQRYLDNKCIKVKKLIPCGKYPTIGDKDNKFNEVWTKHLHVDNETIHFSNGVDLKTNDDGCLVTTTSSGIENVICGGSGPESITILKGNNVTGTITKPGLVLLESTNSTYNIANTGKIGDTIKIIRSKNKEGWEAVVDTKNGYPQGTVYSIFRDGENGPLYIGGQWDNDLGGVKFTKNLARLPENKIYDGSTGPWEAVVNNDDGYPQGTVFTIYRDASNGYLYIGGYWYNQLIGLFGQNIAKLSPDAEEKGDGPWEAVVNNDDGYPNGPVYTISRDASNGYLYIGGRWENDLSDVKYTQSIAKLSPEEEEKKGDGKWEAVVNTDVGYPRGEVFTIYRDALNGYLYIGGSWENELSGVLFTRSIAKISPEEEEKDNGKWKAVVNTGDGYPNGAVFTIYRDASNGYLYIGGQWYNELSSDPFTQNLAKLSQEAEEKGAGPWKPVVNTNDGYPSGFVYKIFKDETDGFLYICGQWENELSGVPFTEHIARLSAESQVESKGPWEAIFNKVGPMGPGVFTKFSSRSSAAVFSIIKDGIAGPLYIGGTWDNNLDDVPNTKKLARIQIFPTNIIADDTKYAIPSVGDTLEFTYTSPTSPIWTKSTYI